MARDVSIHLRAPFAVGDHVARVRLADRTERTVVLRAGRATLTGVPSAPARFWLTDDAAPAGEAPLMHPASDAPGVERQGARVVEVHELFEDGCAFGDDGRAEVWLTWGTHCHRDPAPDDPGRTRFGSFEHVLCAARVGQDAAGRPLQLGGQDAGIDAHTPLPLGKLNLAFGDVVALAGDYYAHLDDAARKAFAWAWPPFGGVLAWIAGDYRHETLAGDGPKNVLALVKVVRSLTNADRSALGEFAALALDPDDRSFPARRYLALASQNHCHFVSPRPGSGPDDAEAPRLYLAYHQRALAEARAAQKAADGHRALRRALATDAFGCHFLTDAFATGHMRTPRRLLAERYGVLKGALRMSLAMHAEDNQLGLWVRAHAPDAEKRRIVWRAYGDSMLRSSVAETHLEQVQHAVRRSAAEVFAAFAAVEYPAAESAEALLPEPLAPGEGPSPVDLVLGARAGPTANHWPLYGWDRAGRIVRRRGDATTNAYVLEDDPREAATLETTR